MQPTKTIWTISVEDHWGTIPVEFGKIPISGSREEVVCSFPYIILSSFQVIEQTWILCSRSLVTVTFDLLTP